jgi:hypothetical protein
MSVQLLPKAGQPQPSPRAGARRAPCAYGRPRDGPTSADAKPRRGAGSGAGPLVRRRSRQPTSRRALPVQTRDELQDSIACAGLVCCIARLNGGARPRETGPPAHQPSRRSRTLENDAAEHPSSQALALARHGGLLCHEPKNVRAKVTGRVAQAVPWRFEIVPLHPTGGLTFYCFDHSSAGTRSCTVQVAA